MKKPTGEAAHFLLICGDAKRLDGHRPTLQLRLLLTVPENNFRKQNDF